MHKSIKLYIVACMIAAITFDSGAPDDSPATNPEEVLMFIIAEGADMVLHQGDMGYGRPEEWIKYGQRHPERGFPLLLLHREP